MSMASSGPTPALFARSRSDDNILNSVENTPKIRRHPPPPPPPPYESKKAIRKPPLPLPTPPMEKLIQKPPVAIPSPSQQPPVAFNPERPPEVPAKPTPPKPSGPSAKLQAQIKKQYPDFDLSTVASIAADQSANDHTSIDIKTLREKSKNLDLPLISALMHDRSLLRQTRAFVMPKHPKSNGSNGLQKGVGGGTGTAPGTPTINGDSPNSNGGSPPGSNPSPKSKYPVSGLSTTQLAKPRKTSASHRHPNDKLPPLPGQTGPGQTGPTAEGNNYVMDPTPTPIKQKSFSSSQPSA